MVCKNLTVGIVAGLLCVFANGPAQSEDQAALRQQRVAVEIVRTFLQCKSQEIVLTPVNRAARLGDTSPMFRFEVEVNPQQREFGDVTVNLERELVTKLVFVNRLQRAAKVNVGSAPIARCKAVANTWLRRVCPLNIDRLVEGEPRMVGARVCMLTWEERGGEENVMTGSRIGMGLDMSSGELVSYALRVAPSAAGIHTVRIREADARGVAEKVITRADKGYSLSANGTLILSSPLAPNEGPVWLFWLLHETKTVDVIVVDAASGVVIAPTAVTVGNHAPMER